MIITNKDYDGRWTVFNTRTGETATIISIKEHGFLATNKIRYRVDVKGETVKSMIDHFQTAKAAAKKFVE